MPTSPSRPEKLLPSVWLGELASMPTAFHFPLKKQGEKTGLLGFIKKKRCLGQVIFVELKCPHEKTAKGESLYIQLVIEKQTSPKAFVQLKALPLEAFIAAEGTVVAKSETENELQVETVRAFNSEVLQPGVSPQVERLRSEKIQNNLRQRQRFLTLVRHYLGEFKFLEVETPVLTRNIPEGAKTFNVPNPYKEGETLSLAQSPQIYKQMLMAGQIGNYFQIAKCFRAEGNRANRQPEFTQLDIETTALTATEIRELVEYVLRSISPELKPFVTMTYTEAMEKYGIEKPNLGAKQFIWVTEYPTYLTKENGELTVSHHPFTKPTNEGFDLVVAGEEIGSGSLRNHQLSEQLEMFANLGYSEAEAYEKFAPLLNALAAGAPPHGGMALGVERLLQHLLELESITETMAFPANNYAENI